MKYASEDLMEEHEGILFGLKILEKMVNNLGGKNKPDDEDFREMINFLKLFADKCHHGKEENYLFKEMLAQGIPNENGPIGAMLQEHAQGRAYIAQMSQSLEAKDLVGFQNAAKQYRDLLRGHITKENFVLFMIADQVIDEESQEQMFEDFELFEETVVGHGVHEELHAMIDTWAEAFGMG